MRSGRTGRGLRCAALRPCRAGGGAPETLTRTGTTPGRSSCERLTARPADDVDEEERLRRHSDAARHDDHAASQPCRMQRCRRGAASAGLRRRGVGSPHDPAAKSATRPVRAEENVGEAGRVDVGAAELRRPGAPASRGAERRARPCCPSTCRRRPSWARCTRGRPATAAAATAGRRRRADPVPDAVERHRRADRHRARLPAHGRAAVGGRHRTCSAGNRDGGARNRGRHGRGDDRRGRRRGHGGRAAPAGRRDDERDRRADVVRRQRVRRRGRAEDRDALRSGGRAAPPLVRERGRRAGPGADRRASASGRPAASR